MATTKKVNNKNNEVSILDMAMNATKDNITTTRRKKSILDMLFSRIYDESNPKVGNPMKKTDLIGRMSLERLELEFEDLDEKLTPEAFQTDETQKLFASINKTVKNGFETAVCNGSTQASFNSNKRYKDYELMKLEDGTYTIVNK